MKKPLSYVLLSSACCAMLALTPIAHAQGTSFPNKVVRIIVPFPAGGSADILARVLGQKLPERWGQQVLVDNRPGAGGNIGADIVAKAAPDGHTLLMGTIALPISAGLYDMLPFDVLRDFEPVTQVASVPMILVVHPSVPAKTVKELVVLAKANPDQLTFSSAGNGTPSHIAGELFKAMTETKLVHVPYKGGAPAVIDLLAGQVSLMLDNSLSVPGHIKTGKLRALGVSTPKRSPLLPSVPTMAEAGVAGYEFTSWFGLLAPARTPREIIDKIYADTRQILLMADVQERLRSQGAAPVANTPGEFARALKADTEKLRRVIKQSGARID